MVDSLSITTVPPKKIEEPWGRLVSRLSTLKTVDICKQVFKIGRAADCDVVIDRKNIISNEFNSISKEHFLLKKGPNNIFYITDLSKNGTFLNGVSIGRNRTLTLKDDDKIAIGQRNLNVYTFKSLLPEQLPDTLTPSETSPFSLTPTATLPIWGRLCACLLYLESFDLCNPTFKVGRSSQCDAVIDKMDIDSNIKNLFSKEHFLITKDSESPITYITDLSKCGTFLNGQLIGKNKKNILQNDDTIGVGPRKKRVYVYKSMQSPDAKYLPEELRKKYEPCTLLGKGGCGEVRLAYEKRTCKMYAIKNILKGRSTTSQMHQLNHPSKIQTEVNILKSLSHPFVIHMKEIVETQENVFIVLEYMKGGVLSNRILSTEPLTESNIKFLFYQMILALQFLHLNGITHRDLKPENVLLSSQNVETLVKVSDFGLSKVTEGDSMMKTVCGTWHYIAPEILDNRFPEYDKQVDVWSLGVILFYMLSKQLPFKSPEKAVLAKLILSGAYTMNDVSWNGISQLAKDLVKKMLTVDPQERITVNDILKHPWLAKDISMQYRVQSLIESATTTENDTVTCSMEPPVKRIRISNSDESTE